MNTHRIRSIPLAALILLLTAGIIPEAMAATYYATKMVIKGAIQDDRGEGNSTVGVASWNQKALINLALGLPPQAKVPAKTVLALRLDGCETPAAQLVVYRKDTSTEAATVSEPFEFSIDPLVKQRNGQTLAARMLATAAYRASGTVDFSINGGSFMMSFKTSGNASAADGCPRTLAGAMLGYINISFIDRLDGQDIPVTRDALILDRSSFSATRIRP